MVRVVTVNKSLVNSSRLRTSTMKTAQLSSCNGEIVSTTLALHIHIAGINLLQQSSTNAEFTVLTTLQHSLPNHVSSIYNKRSKSLFFNLLFTDLVKVHVSSMNVCMYE